MPASMSFRLHCSGSESDQSVTKLVRIHRHTSLRHVHQNFDSTTLNIRMSELHEGNKHSRFDDPGVVVTYR